MRPIDELAYEFAVTEYLIAAKKCCESCFINAESERQQTAVMHGFKAGFNAAEEFYKNKLKIEYDDKCSLQSKINKLDEECFNLKASLNALENGL